MQALQLFEDSPRGVPRVIITITDDMSSMPALTAEKAQLIQENLINSVVIAIGPNLLESEIQAVATNLDSILRYDTTELIVSDAILDRVCPGIV